MKLNSKSQAGTKADSSKKDDATIVRQHSSKPHVISRLSDFEWTCLWMAVRYAMNRQTIASATLPQDIIKNYYSRLNDGQKKSIAKDLKENEDAFEGQAFGHKDIEDKRNKIMLLKKALVRMVAEFDTTTPVVPNQKKALQYANELLLKMMND